MHLNQPRVNCNLVECEPTGFLWLLHGIIPGLKGDMNNAQYHHYSKRTSPIALKQHRLREKDSAKQCDKLMIVFDSFNAKIVKDIQGITN